VDYCPFISFEKKCIFNDKPCHISSDYYYCEIHNRNNPLSDKRGKLIEKRLRSIFSKLKINYIVEYTHFDNTKVGERLGILISDVNHNPIFKIKDDYDLTPYEFNQKILEKIRIGKMEDQGTVEKKRPLTTDEIMVEAIKKPLAEVLEKKVSEKEEHNIRLITVSHPDSTAVIWDNGVNKVFKVRTDMNSFIHNFSVALFAMKCEYLYDLNSSFKNMREIYIFIKSNVKIFIAENSIFFNLDELQIGEYSFPQGGFKNKMNIPYLQKICELLGFQTPPSSTFNSETNFNMEKINGR